MPLREECLWEKLTPQRPDNAALKGEVKVDVCVIGAGFTGLSAAVHLLEQGKTVCVLEAHRAGHGGSGRNVGLVNAGMWIAPDEIEAVSARRSAVSSIACSVRHRPWCSALWIKYNIDCQLRR
jgi:L-2-hydroxyglutarate oxidase LhgO